MGGPYPAEAQQLLRFAGTQELPQGQAVLELAPSEGLQEKHICGCVMSLEPVPSLPCPQSSAQSSSSPLAWVGPMCLLILPRLP